MWRIVPVITEPDFCTLSVTRTWMRLGSVGGGNALLPGRVVHLAPQVMLVGLSAKPLNADGATPPLSTLSFVHWEPQKVTLFSGFR